MLFNTHECTQTLAHIRMHTPTHVSQGIGAEEKLFLKLTGEA